MAKTTPPAADTPALPVAGMTEADREWVKQQIADATKTRDNPEAVKAAFRAAAEAAQRQREWVRREIALASSGVSEAEREEMNP